MEIGITTFIIVGFGILYIGYVIGIAHWAAVLEYREKEKEKQLETYNEVLSNLIKMNGEKSNEEASN